MKNTLSIAQAKARFAEFVRRAEGGATVILTRHGRPVARLAPIEKGLAERRAASGPAREVAETAPPYAAGQPDRVGPRAPESRRELLERLLEESIWSRVPPEQLGVGIDKRERERILGYGSDGV